MVVDKFSPDEGGKQFGTSGNEISIFLGTTEPKTTYQNVQIIASGTANTSNLLTGFINETQIVQSTNSVDYIGKSLGNIRNNPGNRFAKAQFQKNWDFNALPTTSQRAAINTYLTNQFNIPI